jgi:hypothetical protein
MNNRQGMEHGMKSNDRSVFSLTASTMREKRIRDVTIIPVIGISSMREK